MTPKNGFTLLEVLISLLLLSLVLLGVDAAQVLVMRETRGVYYFQQATLLAEAMVEYTGSHHGDPSGYERKWQQQIAGILPIGTGRVSVSRTDMKVEVMWGDTQQVCQKTKQGVKGCVIISVVI